MKCKRLNFEGLRNEEAFQFFTEIKNVTQKIGAESLNIEALFKIFEEHYKTLGIALKHIRKSLLTETIHNADQERDNLYRGFVYAIKSAQLHFAPNKREAAQNVKIIIDHHGNITQKGIDEQTASLKHLLGELERTRSHEIATLAIEEWLSHLHEKNKRVEELVQERDFEVGAQKVICVKDIRMQITQTYRKLLIRIDSLILIKGIDDYKVYVKKLNTITERYKHRLAQRKGRKHEKAL
ncbi:MAG: DUF6261 family protein [Bacteroidales bacterium]